MPNITDIVNIFSKMLIFFFFSALIMPILPENGDKVLIFSGRAVSPNGGCF